MLRVCLVTLLCLVSSAQAALAPLPAQPPETPWPQADWPSGPLPARTDTTALQAGP